MDERRFDILAAAYVRGCALETGAPELPARLADAPLEELDEAELAEAGVITYGSNVKEVTTQVAEATVDCGIIYGTDAYSAGLTVVDTATAEICGQVIYPAAVLNVTRNEAAARAFLEYLTGEEASAVFESVGFSPLS